MARLSKIRIIYNEIRLTVEFFEIISYILYTNRIRRLKIFDKSYCEILTGGDNSCLEK